MIGANIPVHDQLVHLTRLRLERGATHEEIRKDAQGWFIGDDAREAIFKAAGITKDKMFNPSSCCGQEGRISGATGYECPQCGQRWKS